MMRLRRLTLWQRFLVSAWPPYRRRWERNLLDGIRFALEHPEIPVFFE